MNEKKIKKKEKRPKKLGIALFAISSIFIVGIIIFSLLIKDDSSYFVLAEENRNSLPRLVDLGAGKCIPCKKMEPILEELRHEYKGKFEIVFYDVWKDPKPAREFGIRAIPTQIFLDESGKELYRHVGFYSKEDILNTWIRLGYDFR